MDTTFSETGRPDGTAHYHQSRTDRSSLARRRLLVGSILLVLGVLVTATTYAHAAGGGIYVIAWGPMLFGAFRVVQGLWTLAR